MEKKNKTRLARAAMTLLLALLTTVGAWAQTTVTIGDGTATSNTTPIGTLYNYSITEQLYTAEEIGMAGTISSISFYYMGIAAKDLPITVYMENVDAEDLSTGISLAEAEEVFEGTLSVPAEAGWVTINLDTPFTYDGTSNLLIGFKKTGPSTWFSGNTWQYTSAANMARYSQTDSNPYTTATVPATVTNNRPNIQMVITPVSGPVCDKPETLVASNVTANSATLTWSGGSGTYNVEYKKSSDTEWTSLLTNTTATTTTLSELTPGTSYQARVQSVCEGDAVSGWKIVSFSTLFGIPLVEEFGTSIPTGWAQYTGLLESVMTGTPLTSSSYGWSFGTNNGVFDNHARVNIYGTSCYKWLVMPLLLMEDNVQLSFDLALTAYSGTLSAPANTGTDDKFVVLISTDNMTTWAILRQWDNAGSEYVYNNIACSAVGQNVSIDLSSYAGQNIAIAFYGESTASNADNNLHIDNVSINYIPDCAKPTGLAASNVTAHEATISWTSEADVWQIQVGDEEPINVTTNPYTLTGLDAVTAYSVKVRTDCDRGNYSDWTNPVNFTTTIACPAPTGITTSNITGHGVTITWDEVEGAMYQCAMVKTADYNVDNITWSESFDANTQSWNNLDPETGYTFALRKDCGSEDGYSQIVTKTFTTAIACPAPTGLTTTLTPGNGTVATLSWTEPGDATAWVLQYGTSADFTGATSVNVSDNPSANLTGLIAETTYYARVKAVCGGEDGESAWSNTVTFTPTNAYSLTVNDGTITNSYVPVYGTWVDSYTKCQFIIPASELETMKYGKISKMTFYSSTANKTWGAAEFDVLLTEVNNSTFNEATLVDWGNMEQVYHGAVSISDNKMEIVFNNNYQYMGGNLLVGFHQTVTGSYGSISWYGISSESSAIGGYESSAKSLGVQNFLPKTTFDYEPGEAPTCFKPTGLAVNYEGGATATVTWEGEATSYNIDVNGTVTEGVTSPYILEELELATTYTIKVQADCGGGSTSDWTSAVSFTTDLCLPEDMCEISITLTDAYADGGGKIEVVDALTNEVLGTYTNNGASTTYTLAVCDGREINFVFSATDSWSYENGWLITDVNDEVITEHVGCSSSSGCTAPTIGVIATYTVNCTISTCRKPTDLAATEIGPHSAKLSWTENGEATAWVVAYKTGDADFTEVDANTNPYTLTNLSAATAYIVKVRPVCDEEKWSDEITFTSDVAYPAPTGITADNITSTSADISWTGNAAATSYNLRYRAQNLSNMAVVKLTADDVWNDGSGYQMLLDADATAYGTIIPESGALTSSGDASEETYAEFEYKIPVNADGALTTTNMLCGSSAFILIPAGTYDWCITNPTPGDRLWIASNGGNVGGRKDDYVFEAGTVYEFHVYYGGENDATDVTITPVSKKGTGEWTIINNVTSPCALTELRRFTFYEVEVQAVYADGTSEWTGTDFITVEFHETEAITFAKEGYATYYNGEKDVVLPAGMKAHAVAAGGTSLTYAPVADGDTDDYIVPAETAVLLQVEASVGDVDMVKPIYLVTPSGAEYTETNLLLGSNEATETYGGAKYYKLTYSDNNDNFGWYWGAANGGAFISPAHKAWLALPASAPSFLGLPDWEDTTGIIGIDNGQLTIDNGEWYTLQGLKVGKKPTTKGVYIHNGRKVVIK